ncbi:phosphatase PAP2 family protein [Kineosporia sp. J2-2]|uniref:Phosphatase PAP2 family protein n=1 Tax=Kineosporia corallincola TaxID=2835133 RepID=A0ABS5TSQ1_9ACTN|nr:phosphatase PAP2 family protein [Kineosporia corallincola]MBT0773795.1 phosphatase PAP2 family protein [Kineosporia corallincola]
MGKAARSTMRRGGEGMFRAWRGMRELVLLGALWSIYSLSRLLASADLHPALERARAVLGLERRLHLDLETGLNGFTTQHEWLAVGASFYYATAHYVITAAVLIALWFSGYRRYSYARNALVLATVLALTAYLILPTAPPRFVPGYTDVLAGSAHLGWWGGGDSLPGGMGRLTNELAAMPSMHAGWALWVALAVHLLTTGRLLRGLSWGHALLTGLVVIGTGNHWTLDVLTGWLVVGGAWALVSRLQRPGRSRQPEPAGAQSVSLETG